MAEISIVKISALPVAEQIGDEDLLALAQDGATKALAYGTIKEDISEELAPDATLSEAGKAADAKAVADALGTKVNTSTYNAEVSRINDVLATKANANDVNAALERKADTSSVNTLQDATDKLNTDIEYIDSRLSALDGLSEITLESGNITYGWNALTFTDSSTRMRTPENGGVPVTAGDVVTMPEWTGNAVYPIIYGSDEHYHNYDGWKDSDFTIPESGTLYLVVRKEPERSLTSDDKLEVFLKRPDKITELEGDVDELQASVASTEKEIAVLKSGGKNNVYPLLVAHGGVEGLYPEDTILGVLGAKKYGYAYTEADTQVTADGYFVMCHDTTVDRTTDGTGTISEMTLAQVKACTIDAWGAYTYDTWKWENLKIPTLQEYLDACINCGIVPIIEVRATAESQLDNFVSIIKRYSLEGTVIVESFATAALNYLREKSSMKLVALLAATNENIDYCASLGNCDIAINATSVDPTAEFMEYAGTKYVRVIAWTVNDISRIRTLAGLGIWGVITDIAVNGNDFAAAFPVMQKTIPDVDSDEPDSYGFRYYVGNMITAWNVSAEPLKTVVSLTAEIYYDINKPELLLAGVLIHLEDKPGEWQTVSVDTLIRLTTATNVSAQLYLKLAESGNVKMKNATVKFHNI